MINWPSLTFPPINLYSAPVMKRPLFDQTDLDLNYLYTQLARRGKKPTEDDEDVFLDEVEGILGSGRKSRVEARIEAFGRLYG
jgi:hypothetical protein